jgi:gliding motility-associated-like protein
VTNSKDQKSIHEFTVDVDNSCSALFIPSAFTPNFDGQNDVFKAEGRGITQMHMIVYNKLGQIVFESTNLDIGWDGTFKGELSSETYVYHVDYTDAKGIGHVKRGQVTLIK